MTIPNYQLIVEAANRDLGGAITKGPDGAFAVVNLACLRIRAQGDASCGVLYKPSGSQSRERATDILAFKSANSTLVLIDCIYANGDPDARVVWNQSDTLPDQSRWREPYPAEGGSVPPPDPEVPPADLAALVKRLTSLEMAVAALGSALLAQQKAVEALRLDGQALSDRLALVEQRPIPPALNWHLVTKSTAPAGFSVFRHSHQFDAEQP